MLLIRKKGEGKELTVFGGLFFRIYGRVGETIRKKIRSILYKFEDGYFSITLRRIFSVYHRIEVGMYTRGVFDDPRKYPPGTTIGRYCAIYGTARAFGANHPMNTKSVHAFFYNPHLGFSRNDLLIRNTLKIGNDVFIGHNVIITSSVSEIGDGAVIGAGSVLFQDIQPYAIVVGNPARVVRYRFSKSTINELLESRWWEKSLEELSTEIESFQRPLDGTDTIR